MSKKSENEIFQFSQKVQNNISDMASASRTEIESILSEIRKTTTHLTNISEEFGKMKALLPILNMITGNQVSRQEGLFALESFLSHIKNWKEIQDHFTLKNSIANAMSQVRVYLAKVEA